jgi:hypothetical protein
VRWIPRYSEEQVREAVENSRSVAGALRYLGLRAAGNNHVSFKKLIGHYGISITADPTIVPDVDQLATYIEAETAALLAAA